MLRFLAIGAVAWAALNQKVPAAGQADQLLGQPEFIAGVAIALLLLPTVRRLFD